MTDKPNTLSLIDHAVPPEGMLAHAGWVSGFSADAGCMDAFVERFTTMGQRERAALGRTYICLCLDRSQPQILPGEVPGMLHLPAATDDPLFRLMHAKVALLGFRDRTNPRKWALRLLVTTGNWTRQTTQDSLDLVWRLDLNAEDLAHETDPTSRADIVAVRDFWRWLRPFYQCGLFDAAAPDGRQHEPFREMEFWLDRLKAPRGVTPRFLDTRRQSLIAQLPARIDALDGTKRRNTLTLGSGFWEGGTEAGLPRVPERIADALRSSGLLTKGAEITMVFESDDCAALASPAVFASMRQAGWKLRPPLRRPDDNRRLHAKFLFSANWTGGNACASAWAYLGSGNLTPAGFLNAAGRGGNLEAGILMTAKGLHWESQKGVTHVGVVLPVDWTREITDVTSLSAGDGPPERDTLFLAGPVSHLRWFMAPEGGALAAPLGEDSPDLVVIGPDATPLPRNAAGHFPWRGEQPAYAGVARDGRVVQVPVLDDHGRLAARALEPIDLEEAIDKLRNFPVVPETDTNDEGEPPAGTDLNIRLPRAGQMEARYAIRRSMDLLETIAERQTDLPKQDWMAWTRRLHCILLQLGTLPGAAETRASALVEGLLPFALNPLSCLLEPEFLPGYVTPDSPDWAALSHVLADVANNWGMAGFEGFNGEAEHG
ncbi:hypothetical protein [Rhizobium leguminosarum]|uniref:hypothetical protein n=1 Tax=Rhizobium leguminosarum TaxID=384 RepID=UPI0010325CF4|nr:hypothetical protein [Rhizobium leguminosarum]TAY97395.1 hypothetical protein ELH79_02300 [Rhizobium leguminosarum]TAZ08164.1 hypothetical protein ELH78_02300 [Rhizobium leguminosarum]